MFKIEDVQQLSFEVTYDKVSSESWRNGLKSIERGKFLSGNIKAESMFDSGEHVLVLGGDEFGMVVFYDRIMLLAHDVERGSDIPIPRKKPLSKDILRNMSADFNMVVGAVLSAMGTSIDATEFKIEIRLKKDKVVYADRSVEKIINSSIQSNLGSGRVESAAIKFFTNETFLERPARAVYDLDGEFSLEGRSHKAEFSGEMQFGNTGPHDLQDVAVKYIDRINEVVGELVKGVKVNE